MRKYTFKSNNMYHEKNTFYRTVTKSFNLAILETLQEYSFIIRNSFGVDIFHILRI